MNSEKNYWFPTKRYGWGWGLPSTWQGWVLLVGFLALLVLGSVWFPPDRRLGWYLGYVFVLSALFVAVVWCKGEPQRW